MLKIIKTYGGCKVNKQKLYVLAIKYTFKYRDEHKDKVITTCYKTLADRNEVIKGCKRLGFDYATTETYSLELKESDINAEC